MLLQRQTIEKINQERERVDDVCCSSYSLEERSLFRSLVSTPISNSCHTSKNICRVRLQIKITGTPLTNIRYASMSHKTSQCQIQIGQLERGYELAFQGYRTHVEGHTYIWRDAKIKNPNL